MQNAAPAARYINLSERIKPLSVRLPLRLLVVISNPEDPSFPARNIEQEKQRLLNSFNPLIRDGQLEVDWVEPATLQELHRRLRQSEFHVLHYIGRGALDTRNNEPALLLEGGSREARPISATGLGVLLKDYPSLRLVALTPAQGALSSSADSFGSIASTVVGQGLPAVVVVPYESGDGASPLFAAALYASMATGSAMDAAVETTARRVTSRTPVAQGVPILYLGVRDGKIFKLKGGKGTSLSARAKGLMMGAGGLGSLGGIRDRLSSIPGSRIIFGGGAALLGGAAASALVLFGGGDSDNGATVPPTEVIRNGGNGNGGGGGNGSTVVPPTETTEPVERIVFTSQTSAGERDVEQVFSMNVDGSDRQQLTSNLDDSVDPAVLSDCSKVAFIVRSGDAWEVFVLDLASGDQAQVQGPAGRKMEPELSPDGSRVVFALETSGNESTLYVANVDGSDARPLTGSSFDEQDASWSPDGNSIAFVSDRDAPRQNHEVYRIAADGSSGPQRLTTQPGFDGEPSWSPDGGRIAFQSVRDADNLNNFSIWIMDATAGDQGAGLLKLTDQPGREHDPAWSPDGNAVAYTYEDAGTFDVYSVSATGGEPVKLTPDGPRDSRPSWCRS